MQQPVLEAAGLEVSALLPERRSAVGVVLLHGYAMDTADLAPFGSSLRLPAAFFFPRGPCTAASQGRAWWPIDEEARAAQVREGARDLAEVYPTGLAAARSQLTRAVEELCTRFSLDQIVLGGFSQGGMLACDTLLRANLPIRGLVLMSASRIALTDWNSNRHRLRDVPVFVSHGRQDPDLAFEAGERLHDFAKSALANTTWVPFDGGHEIPLPVWRSLRRFLAPII
jgi:phospholipase/carboxylesterase